MQINLKPGTDILNYVLSELGKEAKRLIYGEFGHIFNNCGTKIIIQVIEDPMLIYEECIQFEPRLNKDTALRNLKEFANKYIGTTMYVTNEGYYENGIYRLPKIRLVFYKTNVMKMTLRYLHNLPVFMDYMKLSVRHEVGHMIDLLTYRGRPYNEVEFMKAGIKRAQDNHYRKWNNIRRNDCIDRLYEYYEMPQEKLANKYAGVDPNKLIEYNRILWNEVDGGVTLTIVGQPNNPHSNIRQTYYNGYQQQPQQPFQQPRPRPQLCGYVSNYRKPNPNFNDWSYNYAHGYR